VAENLLHLSRICHIFSLGSYFGFSIV